MIKKVVVNSIKPMTLASERQTKITHTERGLTISGSRATLYDVMDFQKANYPTEFIRSVLNLTDSQLKVALNYIEHNHSEVDADYHNVLVTREEIRQYWEDHNSERFAKIGLTSHPLTKESILSRIESR